MPASGENSDPRDPRVQEEIRDAVRRARGSAFGAFMSEQDLVNAADARLASVYGSGAGLAGEIRREAARHRQPGDERAAPPMAGSALPGQVSGPPPGSALPGQVSGPPSAALNELAIALASAGQLEEARNNLADTY